MYVRVHTDSSAAKAVSSRRGLGKLRHIELKYLWVQELVQEKRIAIKKINGPDNPADCLTMPKDFKSDLKVDSLLPLLCVLLGDVK